MNIKEFIQSQTFKGIIIGFVLTIIGLIVFQAGIVVGEKRATFGHRFGDNFERNFRAPEEGMMFPKFFGEGPMPSGHGAVGQIVSISLPNVVVAGPDNLEKVIVIGADTHIREFQLELTVDDLEVGDHIVTFGEPNEEGQIEAKLVRMLPPPPGAPVDTQTNTQ